MTGTCALLLAQQGRTTEPSSLASDLEYFFCSIHFVFFIVRRHDQIGIHSHFIERREESMRALLLPAFAWCLLAGSVSASMRASAREEQACTSFLVNRYCVFDRLSKKALLIFLDY